MADETLLATGELGEVRMFAFHLLFQRAVPPVQDYLAFIYSHTHGCVYAFQVGTNTWVHRA